MKKTIQFVLITLILLAGGVLTGMAQNSNVVLPESEMMLMSVIQDDLIVRNVSLHPGQTFYVSFLGIYDGSQDVKLVIRRPSGFLDRRSVGEVSAYALCCVSAEDEGDYWFGSMVNSILKFRLFVRLTILSNPIVVAKEINIFKKNKRSNPFGRLICTRTKSLIWRSKMLVLA